MSPRYKTLLSTFASVLGVVVPLLGGALYVVNTAEARAGAKAEEALNHAKQVERKVDAYDAGQRAEMRQFREDLEARHRRTEEKVDRVDAKIDEVLKELRRRR